MAEQPPKWVIEFYQDARGHRPVEAWLDELDVKDRARVRRTSNLLPITARSWECPTAAT